MRTPWTALLLLALVACSEDAAIDGTALDADRGADAGLADLGPQSDATPPTDAAEATDGPPTPRACTHDEDCPAGTYCDQICTPAGPPALSWPHDGVARAAAAGFDITPEYQEPWTDRAQAACPDNRLGRFDGLIDAPPSDDPCADTYEDANANGQFDAIWLGGNERDRPATGVDNDNPPAGRVLVLSQDTHLQVVVVLDVHALEPAQAHGLAGRLGARLGLAPEHITLLATGNRSGPDTVGLAGPGLERFGTGLALHGRLGGALGLVGGLPLRPGVPEGYFQTLAERAAGAIRQAGERLTPVRLRAGRAALPVPFTAVEGALTLPDADGDGVTNSAADRAAFAARRLPLARDRHLPGQIDPDLGVLLLEQAASGAPVALIGTWGAAPATRRGSGLLSADFPGRFRANLERTWPGVVAIWLSGVGADTLIAGEDAFIPEVDGEGNLLDLQGFPTDLLDDAAPAGDPTTALGRLLAALARTVVTHSEPEPMTFAVTRRFAWIPLTNPRFGLAARLGLLPRLGDWLTGRAVSDAWASAMHAPACGGLGCLRHRLDRLDLGPLTLVITPGALDLGYALGRLEASLTFGDERNLLDLDADSLLDAEDPAITRQVSGNGREASITLSGPANPQLFPALVGLESDRVWLIGRGPGVGSLLPRATAQNVFEGQLAPLLEAVRMPAVAEFDACGPWSCRGTIPLGELAHQAWTTQPELLADLPGAHELWLLDEPPAQPVVQWRIEDPAGSVIAAGEHATLGPGRRAWLPEHDLPALGVHGGHLLIATTQDDVLRLPIGGIVPIELRQHPNPADAWTAASIGAGDLIYNAACDLLFQGACPHRRDYGADDPTPGLPTRP